MGPITPAPGNRACDSFPLPPAARAACAGLLAAAWAAAAPAVTLHKRGPAWNRIDVVYVSEGYRAAELPAFAATVERAVRYRDTAFMAEPYRRYRNFFNFYRIDLASAQSGIDEPDRGIYRNTALDGTGSNRLGTVNLSKTFAAVAEGMGSTGVTADWVHAVLNTPGYFNSGGAVCVFSHPNYGEIALHEGGHAFHRLADEYTGPGAYTGLEPGEINVSKDPLAPKWARWKGFRQPGAGLIGSYEGGRYFERGIFRPSPNSKMNMTSHSTPQPFNKPSMEKIVQDIYAKVRPLDNWLDPRTTYPDTQTLWVQVVDPKVLLVDWWVDGVLLRRAGGGAFRPADFPLAAGLHRVTANIYDEAVIHAHSDNANPLPLDWVRAGLDRMQTAVTWTVEVKARPLAKETPGFLPPLEALPVEGSGNLVFDLPRDGGYVLSVVRGDGSLVEVLRGSGRQGRNSRAWTRKQPGPLFLKVDALPGGSGASGRLPRP